MNPCRAILSLALAFLLGSTLLGSTALAQLGHPPASLLGAFEEQGWSRDSEGWYATDDGFRFRIAERGGLAFRLEGEGTLSEADAAAAAAAIAQATGYGQSIRGPVQDFFAERGPALAGQGRVAVGLDEFVLSLELSGEAPYEAEFSLAHAQLATDSFPPARHAIGPDDAAYVIREFSDFQCPFCANYASIALPQIKDDLLARGDVRFEFHHFPLQSIHPNAAPAAEASECVTDANDPDAFWTYHDALFERQQAWAQLGDPYPYFVRLAADLGLSTEGVEACLDERTHAAHIAEAHRVAAGELRLRGTPTVFVNGYRLQEFLEVEAYRAMFDRIEAFAQEETISGAADPPADDAP